MESYLRATAPSLVIGKKVASWGVFRRNTSTNTYLKRILLLCMLVGSLPLHAGVGADGSFSASVPISVPPARNKTQPNLSFDYQSTPRNTPLGVGWTLNQIASISRGNTGSGINFDSSDSFISPDGLLIKMPSGKYLAEYNPTVTYEAIGSCATGPCQWKATLPGNTIIYYGGTELSLNLTATQSQVWPSSNGVHQWLIEKIRTADGDEIHFEYADFGSGKLISRIDYGRFEFLGKIHRISFAYEARPDGIQNLHYAGQSPVYYRLKNVKVEAGLTGGLGFYGFGTTVFNYDVSYVLTNFASQISSIIMSDLNQVTINRWDMQYTVAGGFRGVTPMMPVTSTLSAGYEWSAKRGYVGDFHGYGFGSIVFNQPGTDTWCIMRGSPIFGGLYSSECSSGGLGGGRDWNDGQAYQGDFNADGKQDIAGHISGDIWCIMYGSDTGLLPKQCGSGGLSGGDWNRKAYVADFNGDSKSDLTFFTGGTTWCTMYGTATGFSAPACFSGGLDGALTNLNRADYNSQVGYSDDQAFRPVAYMADFNGDGIADLAMQSYAAQSPSGTLIKYTTQTWCVMLGSPNGLQAQQCNTGGIRGMAHIITGFQPMQGDYNMNAGKAYIGDFNGDGKADVAAHLFREVSNQWCIMYGTTTGLSNAQCFSGGFEDGADWGQGRAYIGDVNGDGRSDLVRNVPGTDSWCTMFGAASGLGGQQCSSGGVGGGADWNKGKAYSADFNNDGFTDFLASVGNSTYCRMMGSPTGLMSQQCFVADGSVGDISNGYVYDFDGDGGLDLINGSGFFGAQTWGGLRFTSAESYGKLNQLTVSPEASVTTISYQKPTKFSAVTFPYPDFTCGFGQAGGACGNIILKQSFVTRTVSTVSDGVTRSFLYSYFNPRTILGTVRQTVDAGFEWISETDLQTGDSTTTYYIQTKPFVGAVAKILKRTSSNTFSVTTQNSNFKQFRCNDDGCLEDNSSDLNHPKIIRSGLSYETTVRNGLVAFKKRETLQYDNFANDTQVIETDNSASQTSAITTLMSFINDTSANRRFFSLPAEKSTCLGSDCSGTILSKIRFYYDGQALNSVGNEGRLTSKQSWAFDDKWLTESYAYDSAGNKSTIVRPNGVTETITYDNDYHMYPATITGSHLGTTTSVIQTFDDRFGSLLTNLDANQLTTTKTLDSRGRVILSETKDRSGAYVSRISSLYHTDTLGDRYVESCTFYANDLLQSICGRKYFDSSGRIIREVIPEFNGQQSNYSVKTFAYDFKGRLSTESLPGIAVDITGQVVPTKFITHTYDAIDRPLKITDFDGRYILTTYDIPPIAGSIVGTRVDTNSLTGIENSKETYTDIRGNKVTVRNYSASSGQIDEVNYSYDFLGRLVSVQTAQGQQIITYDPVSRLKSSLYDPVAGTTNYEYQLDPMAPGFLKLKKEIRSNPNGVGNNVETRFEYGSAFDRLSKVTRTSGGSTGQPDTIADYTYDESSVNYGAGRLTKLSYKTGNFLVEDRFNYNERGETEQVTRRIIDDAHSICADANAMPCLQVFGSKKDKLGRVQELLYPDGKKSMLSYYGGTSLLSSTAHDGTTYATYNNYVQDIALHIGKVTYGNSLEHTYTYDPTTGFPNQFKVSLPSTTVALDLSYTYDRNLRLNRIVDAVIPNLSTTFEFDALRRLKKATNDSGRIRTYQFDHDGQMNSLGNLEVKDKRLLTYESGKTYPISDQVFNDDTGVWETNQTFNWSRGNLMRKGPFAYTYDVNNMMANAVEFESIGSTNVIGETKFYYDYGGQRFLKVHTRAGVAIKTWYLGDGIELREKYTGVSAASEGTLNAWQATKYIYGMDGKKIASITGHVNTSALTASADGMFALANSYSSENVSALALKIYYTFYGIYAHEYFAKVSRWLVLCFAILFLIGYLIRSQKEPLAFPIWIRAVATTLLISLAATSCGTGNSPGSVPNDLGGVGTTGTGSTGATPSNSVISALYTGLPAGTFYYSYNHLGSGALVTDQAGNEVFRMTYTEYGEIDLLNSGKWNANTQQFERDMSDAEIAIAAVKYTGQLYDPETGFYYYNSRYYDPQLGVFTTADTVIPDDEDSQSYNRHMYARGNPVLYSDPTGHNVFDDFFDWWSDNVYKPVRNWWDKNVGSPIRKSIGDNAFNVLAGIFGGLVPFYGMIRASEAGGPLNALLYMVSAGATGLLNMVGCFGCSISISHTYRDGWGFDFGISAGSDSRFVTVGVMWREKGAFKGWNSTVMIGENYGNGMNASLGIIVGASGIQASFSSGYGNEDLAAGARASLYYNYESGTMNDSYDGYSAAQYLPTEHLATSKNGDGRETGTEYGAYNDPLTFSFEPKGNQAFDLLFSEKGLLGIAGQIAGLKPTSVKHDNEVVRNNLDTDNFRFYSSMFSSFAYAQPVADMQYRRIVGYNRFRRGL